MTNQSSLDHASLPILQIYNSLATTSKCRENNRHSARCVELEGRKKFHLGGEAEKAKKDKRKAENWDLRSFTKRVTQQLRSKYCKIFLQKTSVKFWPMVRKSRKQGEKKED